MKIFIWKYASIKAQFSFFCQLFGLKIYSTKKWCWLIAFYVIASKVTRQTKYRCVCRCVCYVITRITLRWNSCRLPGRERERECGQEEARRSCRVLLPVNLCAKLQVPGAYKRQPASVVTSSFYTNTYTHTPTHVCVCVCLYAVYTKIAKLKVRQAFLIGTPKSMLRFSAFFCCERTRAAWREAKRNVYAAWCARCEIYDGSISRGAFHVIVFWVHVSHFDFFASFFATLPKENTCLNKAKGQGGEQPKLKPNIWEMTAANQKFATKNKTKQLP